MEFAIGIILIASLFFMAWYCIKGHNLMTGMALAATLFTVLSLIGIFSYPTRPWKAKAPLMC